MIDGIVSDRHGDRPFTSFQRHAAFFTAFFAVLTVLTAGAVGKIFTIVF